MERLQVVILNSLIYASARACEQCREISLWRKVVHRADTSFIATKIIFSNARRRLQTQNLKVDVQSLLCFYYLSLLLSLGYFNFVVRRHSLHEQSFHYTPYLEAFNSSFRARHSHLRVSGKCHFVQPIIYFGYVRLCPMFAIPFSTGFLNYAFLEELFI